MNRQRILEQLKQGKTFDLLVIGGGATGCGVALDAASRGLSVALVEKNDFAEGTSGRSTKLVHGGVRYLEMAVRKLDRTQYNLVRDGLHERDLLLQNAPHLAHRIALVTPLYKWLEVPYVYLGLKLYDLLAGKRSIGHSRLLSRKDALNRFPQLKEEKLKAGVLYYDGQFNDARLALSLAMTARSYGAVVANHVTVSDLTKKNGRISGARLEDTITGEHWDIEARGIVNATGPFSDRIRQLDDLSADAIISASTGIHVVLDKHFAPPDTGLMIPETEDGRILFVLPWEGHALIGTTDEPSEVDEHPKPTDGEIDYLLRHAGRYFNLEINRSDILAVWSGLRPLVADPKAADTARLARDHVLQKSESGLLTIAGGKWTTYRKMAQDTVDHAVGDFELKPKTSCRTESLPVVGGEEYDPEGGRELERVYGLARKVAAYINRIYGDQGDKVAKLASNGYASGLVDAHPFIEAEVVYAVRHEQAERPVDVLARRLPLALLDSTAALQALPRVFELMQQELGWNSDRCIQEKEVAEKRLREAL